MRLTGQRHVKTVVMSALLWALANLGACQQAPPTVTTKITDEGVVRHYEYTVLNSARDHAGQPMDINGLIISVTGVGFKAITNHSEQMNWTYGFFYAGGPGWGSSFGWTTSGVLSPGATATFNLYTAASVATMYSGPLPSNWKWGGPFEQGPGNSFIPVPAPEPGTCAGIACGLGVLAIARRRGK